MGRCHTIIPLKVLEKGSFGTRKSEFVQISLDQDDIVPDLTDAFPRNDILLLSSQQTEGSGLSGDDHVADLPVTTIHFHIAHKTQSTTVADIDYLFTLEC